METPTTEQTTILEAAVRKELPYLPASAANEAVMRLHLQVGSLEREKAMLESERDALEGALIAVIPNCLIRNTYNVCTNPECAARSYCQEI